MGVENNERRRLSRKVNKKYVIDFVLLLLFGAMCNTEVTGTEFHEVAGLVYTALIVVHLILNRKWIVAVFYKGRGGKRQTALAAVNMGLLADLIVILATGIRASHYLLPATEKAPDYFLAIHAISGVIAAGLVLSHVLLHAKVITKSKLPRSIALAAVLTIVIGYSFAGTIQGTLKWTEGKGDRPGVEQHDKEDGSGVHQQKDGERKQGEN